jgi:polygalacturonase
VDAPVVTGSLPWPEANAIVAAVMAAMPVFPARNCTVTDAAYGGRSDGTTDNTDAFKKAIAACSQAGGGHVVVPPGDYLTGAIELQDNVDLHLERGTTILFSGDESKYPIVLTRYEGIEHMNNSPMIYAYQKKNIAVTGPGVLDASRTASWNTGSGRARLEQWADDNVPVAQRVGNQSRTSFVEPYACTNVLISGITLRGSRFWQLHPTLSKFVLIDGVTTTDSGASNNDGFDPESTDHIVLTNSVIDAGDDAIAVKSGRDADGRRINKPTSNLVIMHSTFSSRWGMLTLGSELTGGIQNVYAYDLRTSAGKTVKYMLELKGNSQRGGFITDVHLDTVRAVRGVTSAVMWADMQYMGQTGPYSPKYDKFTLSHFTVDGAPMVLDLTGMSAANPLGSVAVDHSTFTNITNPTNHIEDVRSVTWDQVTINGAPAR